jgi:ligand-binding sensor domain-containing protein
MRAVYMGRDGALYVAGYAGVARRDGDKFVLVIGPAEMGRDIVSTLTEDRHGNLWVAGNFGLVMRSRAGKIRRFQTSDGLPDNFVRSIWEDRDGNL